MFCEKDVFRNFTKFTGKHLWESLNFVGEPILFKKETLAQVFSCEFCEISKKAFFTEHLWTTASGFGIVLRKMLELEYLKLELTQYRFENLPICLHSYENNTLNISHS